MMLANKLRSIVQFSDSRVRSFGAPYTLFGCFAIFNFVIPYFFWSQADLPFAHTILYLRLFAAILCFLLIIKGYFSRHILLYMPVYWHLTILYCLPFYTMMMLYLHPNSLLWFVNFNASLFLMGILVDWLSYILLLCMGCGIATLLFYTICPTNCLVFLLSEPDYIYAALYMVLFSALVALLFLRAKEKRQKGTVELLERRAQERDEHLEKALSARRDFLNNISHEIRIPIQAITAIARGLVEQWHHFEQEKRFELVQQLDQSSERLYSLTNCLLDYSHMATGRMSLDPQLICFSRLVVRVIEEYRHLAEEKNICIHFEHDDIPPIVCDPMRMSQVISNLLNNAIKFSPDGDILIKLYVKMNRFYCVVSDAGVGIPDVELHAVFEPFIQSRRTYKGAGGAGLGLSIVHQIIKAHYGEIWAENNPTGGASFVFHLPIDYRQEMQATDGRDEYFEGFELMAEGRILVIDDEESCLSSLQMILERVGLSVVTAVGGRAGYNYLKQNHHDIDLVLLDIMMPDMYGINVLSEIVHDDEFSHLSVVMQTGIMDEVEIARAISIGAVDYITKPYSPRHVIEVVMKVLTERARAKKDELCDW